MVSIDTNGGESRSQISKVQDDTGEAVQAQSTGPIPHSVSEQPECRSTSDKETSPVPSILLSAKDEIDKKNGHSCSSQRDYEEREEQESESVVSAITEETGKDKV